MIKVKTNGIYNDFGEILIDNLLIHRGSIIELIEHSNNSVFLNINNDTNFTSIYILKKIGELIIAIPKKEEIVFKQFNFHVILMTNDECVNLIDISFSEDALIDEIELIKPSDLELFWLSFYKGKLKYSSFNEMRLSLYSSIVFIDDDNINVKMLMSQFEKNKISIKKYDIGSKLISIFYEINDEISELKPIFINDDCIYFVINDTYCFTFY